MIKEYIRVIPKVISAVQFDNTNKCIDEIHALTHMNIVSVRQPIMRGIGIHSLSMNGTFNVNMAFDFGDYIFKDESDNIGVIKKDIFEKEWKAVDSENNT